MTDQPNPYEAPDESGSPPQFQQHVLEIAKAQRFTCFIILVAILFTLIAAVMQRVNPLPTTVILPVQLLVSIAQVVAMYRLGRTVYNSLAAGIGMAVLALIPCIGLVALVLVNQKATSILQAHGYRVGLMGADLSQFR